MLQAMSIEDTVCSARKKMFLWCVWSQWYVF